MSGNTHSEKNPVTESSSDYRHAFNKPANSAIPFAQRVSCSVTEACVVTGLGRTKLYELIGSGVVDTTLIGRRRLVSVKSLLRLITFESETESAKNS